MASKQCKIADDFAATFPDKVIQQWRRMVKDWQENTSRPNPYVLNERGMFFDSAQSLCLTIISPASKLSEAQLRLTQEEVAEAERGQHVLHKVTTSVFIQMGLELEDQQ